MLHGEHISLRPIREADLDAVHAAHVEIRNRGAFFPLGVQSEPAFRRAFAENGLWEREEGMLLLVTDEGDIAGHIEFFKPVNYWDAFEAVVPAVRRPLRRSWLRQRGRPAAGHYLFGVKKQHRIQLVIVPENAASRRIAEKCGFTLEGTARGAFFNDGRNQDVLLYSLLRTDARPWHGR